MREWVIYLQEGWYANYRPAAPFPALKRATDHQFVNEASMIAGAFAFCIFLGGRKAAVRDRIPPIFSFSIGHSIAKSMICQSRTVIIIHLEKNPETWQSALHNMKHCDHRLHSVVFSDKCIVLHFG